MIFERLEMRSQYINDAVHLNLNFVGRAEVEFVYTNESTKVTCELLNYQLISDDLMSTFPLLGDCLRTSLGAALMYPRLDIIYTEHDDTAVASQDQEEMARIFAAADGDGFDSSGDDALIDLLTNLKFFAA